MLRPRQVGTAFHKRILEEERYEVKYAVAENEDALTVLIGGEVWYQEVDASSVALGLGASEKVELGWKVYRVWV